jgi:OPA family glycerol-3-phosphate transporter-like MFS transporter
MTSADIPVSGVPVETTANRSVLAWQILTVTLLVAGYSGYYLCRSNFSVVMPLLVEDLAGRGIDPNSARVTLGSIASLGVLAYAIGKFFGGGLADYLGGRRNFLGGMGGSILFTVLFSLSGGIPAFTLAWMGNRAIQSLGWAGMVKITSKWFSFKNYGTVMAIISLSYLFGDALARQFMAALIDAGFGWRGVFHVGAGVLFVLLVLCLFLLRESPIDIGSPEAQANPGNLFGNGAGDAEQDRTESSSAFAFLMHFLRSPAFLLVCALSLGTTILRETFNLWTPTYFTQAAGMSVAQAASASSLFPFLGGVSVVLCGWLSDRLGRSGRAALMFAGLLLSTVALFMMGLGSAQGSHLLPVVLVALVAFLTIGPYSFLGGAISLDFGGKKGSGTASGLIDGVGYLGGVLSGDSMARVSVRYGWSGAFLMLAGVGLLSSLAALVYLAGERKRAQA